MKTNERGCGWRYLTPRASRDPVSTGTSSSKEALLVSIYEHLPAREDLHLPLKEAERLRARSRRMLGVWIDQLRRARPDFGRDQVDATARA